MRIVLDANVVIAAFAARGLCDTIIEFCLDSHDILLSEDLILEISSNLRKKIKIAPQVVDKIMNLLRENAEVLIPEHLSSKLCRDPDDLHVLGLAITGKADCIVTGDKDLLVLKKFHNIPILSPREFSVFIHK
ncbi:MAG: putative toxin-antitoxin system toxin component, PIN family [Lentisphaerae bacterium RIFOXYA12_FULL_48_11]|nr:MAG: putative toxin-antitoxin system toxin component, PIN family [Lentisphaerae bacterium RIFOXYA12_FULL_48_11]